MSDIIPKASLFTHADCVNFTSCVHMVLTIWDAHILDMESVPLASIALLLWNPHCGWTVSQLMYADIPWGLITFPWSVDGILALCFQCALTADWLRVIMETSYVVLGVYLTLFFYNYGKLPSAESWFFLQCNWLLRDAVYVCMPTMCLHAHLKLNTKNFDVDSKQFSCCKTSLGRYMTLGQCCSVSSLQWRHLLDYRVFFIESVHQNFPDYTSNSFSNML